MVTEKLLVDVVWCGVVKSLEASRGHHFIYTYNENCTTIKNNNNFYFIKIKKRL